MKVLILIIILFLILRIKKENFTNYILYQEPKNNFYYRFVDYVLNNRHPRNNAILVKDQYGYTHLLDKRYDPRVINPMFIFDQNLWYNPNSSQIIKI